MNLPSHVSKILLEQREFYVKRDDLIDPFLSGNKYRKLYSLYNTPNDKYHTIISYGGSQSNAMLAIAAMCAKKGWKFLYYTKPLSEAQKNQKEGNFFDAIKLGMLHTEIEQEHYESFISSLHLNLDEQTYLLDQGGADSLAKEGLEVLADEIRSETIDIDALALPSGTGTTALYLALALPEYKIYTTPCIGDKEYLQKQMRALEDIPKNLIILEPKKKYHFAKLYPEFYELYQKLLQAGIEFDLLYAPLMWQTLLEQTDEKIMYVHSGGVSGNKTMLQRYERKKAK